MHHFFDRNPEVDLTRELNLAQKITEDVIMPCIDWLLPFITFILVLFILGAAAIGLKYLYRYFMGIQDEKKANLSKRIEDLNKVQDDLAKRWKECNNKEAELNLRESGYTNASYRPKNQTAAPQPSLARPIPPIK